MGCLFCDFVEKTKSTNVVYEDDHALAFRDINPQAPTHILVVPKKHIAAIHDLAPADAEAIGQVMFAARKVAETEGLVKDGFRLVINDGDAAGQTVHHIHVHVLGGRRGLVSARLACESIEPVIQRGEQFLHHGIGPDVESVERHSKVRQSIALMEAISFEA